MISIDQLRKPKIYKMAIFDILGTFIIACIFQNLLWYYPLDIYKDNKRTYSQYFLLLVIIFIMLIGVGIILHRLFGIRSALSGYLGINIMPR